MITAIKSPIDRVLHLIIPKEFSFNTTITVNQRLIDMSTTTPKNLDLIANLTKCDACHSDKKTISIILNVNESKGKDLW